MEKLTSDQLKLWEDLIDGWIDRHYLVYESEKVVEWIRMQPDLWKKINSLPVK